MSDKSDNKKSPRIQSEAHSTPAMPKFEYEVPRYSGSDENFTTGASKKADLVALDAVSLNNFHG